LFNAIIEKKTIKFETDLFSVLIKSKTLPKSLDRISLNPPARKREVYIKKSKSSNRIKDVKHNFYFIIIRL
jgi:hypothetical protein